MATVTAYPGIYTEESTSLNFSVTASPTAVPAFLFTRSGAGNITQPFNRFDSWAEYKAINAEGHTNEIFYNVLRYWFSQGGGRCYLIDYASYANYLDKYDDITLVVACGRTNNLINNLSAAAGTAGQRFVLLDGPEEAINSDDLPTALADFPDSPYAAIWYPWLKTSWGTVSLPPSVAAAVAISQTDRLRGVWKSPANVILNNVTPLYNVSDDFQGAANAIKGINVFRTFIAGNTVAWGARTLDSSDNWRYIAVRRLFSRVETDISRALRIVMFEPNSQPTWQRVRAVVDSYLHGLWQQGALMGNRPEDAWFVQIGKDITMTDEDISQGKMIVKVGLAASRPAEFIILQFSQSINLL
ncbi:phage tail sheath family protein [Erwinia oleae]|uniref:phage tail sheath family protein n=1 Tax=Erwinia oleae TaxID=796334 RepID=UPI00055460FA|nr:phage tail sheath C-terminal domain-containing protein [Erwinia oleae]